MPNFVLPFEDHVRVRRQLPIDEKNITCADCVTLTQSSVEISHGRHPLTRACSIIIYIQQASGTTLTILAGGKPIFENSRMDNILADDLAIPIL